MIPVSVDFLKILIVVLKSLLDSIQDLTIKALPSLFEFVLDLSIGAAHWSARLA